MNHITLIVEIVEEVPDGVIGVTLSPLALLDRSPTIADPTSLVQRKMKSGYYLTNTSKNELAPRFENVHLKTHVLVLICFYTWGNVQNIKPVQTCRGFIFRTFRADLHYTLSKGSKIWMKSWGLDNFPPLAPTGLAMYWLIHVAVNKI